MDILETSKEYSVLNNGCPSRSVLELVAGKWTILVVYSLANGMLRYGELRRMITGISKKMLTQTLRELERNGVVHRKVYPIVPPRVEYTLTPLGHSLLETLSGLCAWSESHIEEVKEARIQYDDVQSQL